MCSLLRCGNRTRAEWREGMKDALLPDQAGSSFLSFLAALHFPGSLHVPRYGYTFVRTAKQNSYATNQKGITCLLILHLLSLFNVRAMPNWCCDQFDKKQPDSEREWLRVCLTEIWTADLHDSISGGDQVYQLSAIPSVRFRSNSFAVHRPSPMLVWKMPTPGHGDSDSSRIATSTSPPDAGITWHATVTSICLLLFSAVIFLWDSFMAV